MRQAQRGILLLGILLFGVAPFASAADGNFQIIPCPASVEQRDGQFVLNRQTAILIEDDAAEVKQLAEFLREGIRSQTGCRWKIKNAKSAVSSGRRIALGINPASAALGKEGYELTISPNEITLDANQPTGLFYGIQSLLQMASPGLAANPTATEIHLPAVRIVDQPRFAWRGLMLDCSRTFLPLEILKKYVDVLSFYKMNVLHLHLTDDQGWRLEIRKHPKLTQIGSKFDSRFPGEVSGYYSQKQIKELVRYAAERHVTIVPEIEMPAHCLAFLKSYPELSCRGGKDEYVIAPYQFQSDFDPRKEPKTPHGVMCPGNEKTFEVIADVLDEVVDLFPGEYIHIAGDECPKNFWKRCPKCQARIKSEGLSNVEELQSYFIKRVAKMIEARRRKAMGWEDVLQGGLAPGVAVMSWRSFEAGITAAKLGHPVVMASKSHVYFDYSYNRSPASLVYHYEPIQPELDTPDLRGRVLGGQACMWTHLTRSETGIDMSIFPRLLALAEVLWTPVERKDWADFSNRMTLHEQVLKSKGVTCFEWNRGLGLPNLTCGQDGRLWLVNSANEIHLRRSDTWERFPGKARQVTSGPDGTIWAVSAQPTTGGYELVRWSETERKWTPLGKDIAAVQISAAPDGSLWAATEAYAVYRFAGTNWSNVQGLAREVSAGSDGRVWILTMDPSRDGYELLAAPPRGHFRRVEPIGSGTHISAGKSEELWLCGRNGNVRLLRDGKYRNISGKLSAITASPDGKTWGLILSDSAPTNIVEWTAQGWKSVGPIP